MNEDKDNVSHCVYRQPKDPSRELFEPRGTRLNDYWQMNRECKRSGINLTRTDFNKMAKAITAFSTENGPKELNALATAFGDENTDNAYQTVSKFFINNDAPANLKKKAPKMVDSIVNFTFIKMRQCFKDIP